MQDEINSVIDPNWIKNANPFMMAAALEYAEAIEHYGWKWWKKQTPDLNQVKMEMVDIWHFMLSQITIDLTEERTSVTLEILLDIPSNIRDFERITIIDSVYALSDLQLLNDSMGMAALNVVNIPVFMHLCSRFGLTEEELFKLYVGKNVLNTFRQANGYKEGTYTKVWSGREDNEYLTDIMNNMKLDSSNLKEEVYQALSAAYATHA
tara:strand:- start:95 stop:718 length:624 start_codon:yes stop_codon:yes gene_type:complete